MIGKRVVLVLCLVASHAVAILAGHQLSKHSKSGTAVVSVSGTAVVSVDHYICVDSRKALYVELDGLDYNLCNTRSRIEFHGALEHALSQTKPPQALEVIASSNQAAMCLDYMRVMAIAVGLETFKVRLRDAGRSVLIRAIGPYSAFNYIDRPDPPKLEDYRDGETVLRTGNVNVRFVWARLDADQVRYGANPADAHVVIVVDEKSTCGALVSLIAQLEQEGATALPVFPSHHWDDDEPH